MKKIILPIIIIAFCSISCKAQSPILPRYSSDYGHTNNAYYKDIENELNPYLGTWLYTSSNDTLKIVLKKKEQIHILNFYTDFIYGGYQFVEDGVEKLNSLNQANNNTLNIHDYDLYGNMLIKKHIYPLCTECSDEEKRLVLLYNEPITRDVDDLSAKMVLRKVIEGGIEKLKVRFYLATLSLGYKKDGTATTIESHTLPYGEYTLIKQP